MPRCGGFKPDSSPCERIVPESQSYCYSHDPSRSAQRSRAASIAAKSKVPVVLSDLHRLLEDLTQRVIDGKLETSRGAVANQLISTRIRLLDLERKIKQTEELEERLSAIEEALESPGRRISWKV